MPGCTVVTSTSGAIITLEQCEFIDRYSPFVWAAFIHAECEGLSGGAGWVGCGTYVNSHKEIMFTVNIHGNSRKHQYYKCFLQEEAKEIIRELLEKHEDLRSEQLQYVFSMNRE